MNVFKDSVCFLKGVFKTINSELLQKMNEQSDELRQIIEESSLSAEKKDTLTKLFSRLNEYSRNHIELIENSVEEQMRYRFNGEDENFKVKTALVRKEKAETLRRSHILDYICKPDKDSLGVFFDCSYEEFIRFCDKRTYKVTVRTSTQISDCSCELRPDFRYVSQEEILYRTAYQYRIKKPVIFSPYARKYASLKLKNCDLKPEYITEIIIDGIPEKITKTTCEYSLMWNVSVSGEEEVREFPYIQIPAPKELITPYFENTLYKKTFSEISPYDYIVFDLSGKENFFFLRNRKELYISSDYDIINMSYSKVTLLNGSFDEDTECFFNFFKPNIFLNTRVRSHADILYVLNSFNNNPYHINISEEFKVEVPEKLETIKNYDKQNASYYRNNSHSINKTKNLRSSLNCVIYFYGGKFTEDYANYVLEYLNEKYPEFNWQGVLS